MNKNNRIPWRFVLCFSLLLVLFTLTGSLVTTANPNTVTVAGSLQSELGCPGDWQPECANTYLTYDAEDDIWHGSFDVPAGNWEYKAALNDSWDENYGANATRDGANIPLNLGSDTAVKFYYDDKSHWITDNQNSVIATVPGDFQSELGCLGDWDPSCLRSWLQDPDGDGTYSFTSTTIPAGEYQAKVAISESWDENYGEGGVFDGPNIAFRVANTGDVVSFSYDHTTNILDISITPTIPVDDAELVRPVLQHPFQDDILYFAIPDRFNDGDPDNNCGSYTGPCVEDDAQENVLTHGYLPVNRGYYHGGDLEGLRKKLPYLKTLGVTAVWVGPIYENKTVQPDSTSLYGHSSGYHGYWILDFLKVDPHLGTNEEFRRLVEGAHAKGIKVFMDIVTNHTADVIQLEGNAGYRNKTDFPYLDANGDPFDDSDFAYYGQPDYTFPDVNANTFPYNPIVPAGDEDAKNPDWLNDPFLYHNRGDSSFVGENSLYGDFFGLDDLWTERKEVVEGMIDIFSFWIEEFEVDGFRIDTTKHANMEFWQKFGPEILAAAEEEGIDHFFAFGEVFDQQFGPPFLSEFSGKGQLQSTIDFAFQLAARDFASQSGATNNLRDFFELDDYYIDADSNAYSQPTFLGNHDMGRIGHFLQRVDQSDANDDELLARSQLAHALMYFSRGQPVIYYGDEQGFTGDGGDKLARQDMFANFVPEYDDDNLIGTHQNTSDNNFNRFHPIYRTLRHYSWIYKWHQALRRGAQIHRYSTDGPGVYAFSRIEREQKVEYIVALNNSEDARTVNVPTFYPPNSKFLLITRWFAPVHPRPRILLRTDANGELNLTVPPLSMVIYRALHDLSDSTAAPNIQISNLQHGQNLTLGINNWDGHEVVDRVEVQAELDANVYAEVTFAVRVNGGEYVPIGTDDNPPYRVFYDASRFRGQEGTRLSFRAIVNDLSDEMHLNSDEVVNIGIEVEEPQPAALPYAVIHYNRPLGDYGDHTTGDFNDFWGLHLWGNGINISDVTDWANPKPFLGEDEFGRFAWVNLTDETLPLNFIVHQGDIKDPIGSPDRSFIPADSPEIWLNEGDLAVYTSQATAQGYVTVHYHRPDGDYGDPTSNDFNDFWGLHLWGNAIDPSETTAWTDPKKPTGFDDYGAFWNILIVDPSQPVNFIIHRGDQKDPGPDQSFMPEEAAIIWIQSGDETVYNQRGAAEGYIVLHYHRPAGDYGDYTSNDFNDFWGLHTWNDADDPGWTTPRKATDRDVFGVFFKVELTNNKERVGYVLHRGDEKDPGPDQFLDVTTHGYEVWQLQGADPAKPYVLPIVIP